MNQSDFLDEVLDDLSENTTVQVTKKDLKLILKAQLSTIKTLLVKGDSVLFADFGKFATVNRKERSARNPKTGEKMVIPAKRAVKFVVGNGLKDAVKGAE